MNTNAFETLEAVVVGLQLGIDKCRDYPNASTDNLSVQAILEAVKNTVNHAMMEILKGNVK